MVDLFAGDGKSQMGHMVSKRVRTSYHLPSKNLFSNSEKREIIAPKKMPKRIYQSTFMHLKTTWKNISYRKQKDKTFVIHRFTSESIK